MSAHSTGRLSTRGTIAAAARSDGASRAAWAPSLPCTCCWRAQHMEFVDWIGLG